MINHFKDINNNELLKTIIEVLDAVVISDSEGRYVYVNKNWSDLMGGIDLEEIKGMHVHDIVPETKVDEAIRTGKILTANDIRINNKRMFCTYIPIFKNNEVVGCFTYIVFRGMDEAMNFAAKVNGLANEVEYYKRELKEIRGAKYSINNIIGKSVGIRKVKREIYKASRSMSTVLIEGETGVGKELVAHSIHDLSQRMEASFIKVNCSAIPSELLESEFFGYEEGAFTGAKSGGKNGFFEMANNGTLFLDEITDVPLFMQSKLLRVLQENEYIKIGGKKTHKCNVRVISATNKNIYEQIRKGKFRADLFYRLNTFILEIPPLRKRKDDIIQLSTYFVKEYCEQSLIPIKSISDGAIEKLISYDWPGNIRELKNVIECSIVFSDDNNIKKNDIIFNRENFDNEKIDNKQSLEEYLNSKEKEYILKVIKSCNGNKTLAAKVLSIHRTSLYNKLK